MSKTFKAMKVKIGRRPEGGWLYPDFNTLPVIIASPLSATKYIDTHCLGIEYDKTSSHNDDSTGSDFGFIWAMVIGDTTFIEQADANLADCTYLSPVAAAALWESRITPYEDEELLDERVLRSLANKKALASISGVTIVITDHQKAALDVGNDDVPGIRKNHHKLLADYGAKKGFVLA